MPSIELVDELSRTDACQRGHAFTRDADVAHFGTAPDISISDDDMSSGDAAPPWVMSITSARPLKRDPSLQHAELGAQQFGIE